MLEKLGVNESMDGFSQDTLDFLKEVREQNSKEWFKENKDRYLEFLIEPLQGFVRKLSKVMYTIDEEFELAPSVNKTISKINRDTRFSKDKTLYKDKMWVVFRKCGKSKTDYPAFFFEVTPYSYRYGMGFFLASNDSMRKVREEILDKQEQFVRLITKMEEDGVFHVEGDMYKRNMYPDSTPMLQQLLNRKNIYVVYNSQFVEDLMDESYIEMVKKNYASLAGLYDFFVQAVK